MTQLREYTFIIPRLVMDIILRDLPESGYLIDCDFVPEPWLHLVVLTTDLEAQRAELSLWLDEARVPYNLYAVITDMTTQVAISDRHHFLHFIRYIGDERKQVALSDPGLPRIEFSQEDMRQVHVFHFKEFLRPCANPKTGL